MRREVVGVLAIGALVGVAVFAVRVFLPDRLQSQWGALALVALIIVVVQAALILRHRNLRPGGQDGAERDGVARSAPRNPFARELNREWTGLTDRIPDDAAPHEPVYPEEHIYDLPPTTPWRVDKRTTPPGGLPVPTDDPPAPHTPHNGRDQ